ncbi:adhesin [Virgibacillus sp. 7505]|uniref:metal ABC transporter solute-binding protein, Zn/Mn family n=1 Tax=Virgibacillus sp. 7505 TaxID=2022548 RepID=UPI000BA4FBB4|nr:zinc ABC transporter substrate-binding protein [Virgibacillus sp. 7505]PAE18061.1 adhesin [Virgibacillus sp. 7505]
MKKSLFLISTALLLVLLAACGNDDSQKSTEDGKLKVYTTIYPIQYFAERIGGDQVEVESVLPPGSDAHNFEPTSNQMVDIAKSDAFLYSSDELETYAKTIADAVGDEDVKIAQLAEGINLLPFEEEHDHSHEATEEEHDHSQEATEDEHDHEEEATEEEHDHGSIDPHYWLDPERAKQMAENMKNTLVELDPDNETTYEDNYAAVAKELDELDQKFQQAVEGKDNKKIIVSHAAYGYWEDRYGIEQIAITGLSPTNEPSQQELEEIIHTAEDNKLNYVLFEQNISPKVATIVQDEIGADVLRIHNLETVTEDEIDAGEDYFSLMDKNIETLEQALTNK